MHVDVVDFELQLIVRPVSDRGTHHNDGRPVEGYVNEEILPLEVFAIISAQLVVAVDCLDGLKLELLYNHPNTVDVECAVRAREMDLAIGSLPAGKREIRR